jgi:hypothetical protein
VRSRTSNPTIIVSSSDRTGDGIHVGFRVKRPGALSRRRFSFEFELQADRLQTGRTTIWATRLDNRDCKRPILGHPEARVVRPEEERAEANCVENDADEGRLFDSICLLSERATCFYALLVRMKNRYHHFDCDDIGTRLSGMHREKFQ